MFKSAWRWSKKLSSILGFQAKGLSTCPTYHRFRVVCKSEFLETPQSSANQNSWSPYLFPAQAFLPNKQEAVHNICLPAVCCLQSDSPVPYPSALATSNHHPFSVGPSARQILQPWKHPSHTNVPHKKERTITQDAEGMRTCRKSNPPLPVTGLQEDKNEVEKNAQTNSIYQIFLFILCKVFLVLINASFPSTILISASISFLEACDYSNSAFG